MLTLLVAPVFAGGTDIEQETIVTGGDNTAENNALISGSRAYSLGLGDVDINQCYRSYQILIWQDSKVNKWCMADSLDAKGLHDAAALMRCSLRPVRALFGSDRECIAALTVREREVVLAPVAVEREVDDEDNRRLEALQARLEMIEQQRTQDAERVRKASIVARQAAQKAEEAERERKEFAQQTLDELAEYRK